MGDDTAKNMGRLTLNPFAHLDLLGTICLILLRFGWAKPVGINPNKFKNRRAGMLLSALAGPVMNLLLAVISAFIYFLLKYMLFYSTSSVAAQVFINIVYYILYTTHFYVCLI
jgi:Zn-dependent protease